MRRLFSQFGYVALWVLALVAFGALLLAFYIAINPKAEDESQQSQSPDAIVLQKKTPNRDANPTGEPEEEPTPGPAETAPPSTPGVFTPPPAPQIPTPDTESSYYVQAEENLLAGGSPLSVSDWSPSSDAVLLDVFSGKTVEMKNVALPSGVLAQFKPLFDLTLLSMSKRETVKLVENAEDGQWSPGGTEILFRRYLEGTETELYVMPSADPNSLEKLANADLAEFGWVKQGILYYAQHSRLQQLDVSTKQSIESPFLDLQSFGGDIEPKVISYSSNGKKLAYGNGNELVIMDASGEGSQVISTSFFNLQHNLRWSPDNRQLAYVEYLPESFFAIQVYDVESGKVKEIVREQSEITWLSWFPESNAILFNLHQGGANWLINVVTLDTHQTYSLTGGSHPSLSPDGRKVVFQRHDDDLWLLTLGSK